MDDHAKRANVVGIGETHQAELTAHWPNEAMWTLLYELGDLRNENKELRHRIEMLGEVP